VNKMQHDNQSIIAFKVTTISYKVVNLNQYNVLARNASSSWTVCRNTLRCTEMKFSEKCWSRRVRSVVIQPPVLQLEQCNPRTFTFIVILSAIYALKCI
jgi:hypothetical protein